MSRRTLDVNLLAEIDQCLINASNRLAWLAPAFEPGSDEHERCYRLANDVSQLARRIERRFAPYRADSIQPDAAGGTHPASASQIQIQEENLTQADHSA